MAETNGNNNMSASARMVIALAPTVIAVVSAAAFVFGSWAVMGKDISDLRGDLTLITADNRQLSRDVFEVSAKLRVLESKHDNLNALVVELRRQSGLRVTPTP